MWCVGELGLEYQRFDVGHRYGGTDADAFVAMNPNRTVPVLRDGANPPLWETGCILRYLASRYGDDEFWPRDLVARAHVDRWAEWSKINIAMDFTSPVFWRVVRTPAQKRNPEAIRNAVFEGGTPESTEADLVRLVSARLSDGGQDLVTYTEIKEAIQ